MIDCYSNNGIQGDATGKRISTLDATRFTFCPPAPEDLEYFTVNDCTGMTPTVNVWSH